MLFLYIYCGVFVFNYLVLNSASVGGELYPAWMHFFQAPYCLYSLFIAFLSFFTSRSDQRTLPWRGDQS